MTLTLKLIVFFSLLPFLEASRLKASIVKDVFCKDCEKLKSGMIQNFFVSDSGNVDLSMLTNINKKVDFGEEFFNYDYLVYPIMTDTVWQDYAVELHESGQIKLFQEKPRFSEGPYCYSENNNLMDSFKNIYERSFFISHYLVLNSTHVTDVRDACKEFKLYPISKALSNVKSQEIEPCFKNNDIRCVYDISNKKIDLIDQKQRKRPFLVYSRYNIIVWAAHLENKEGHRHALYLYDKNNNKDYWIDDDIKYSSNEQKNPLRGIVVPLLEPHDPFLDLVKKGKN